jgi:hypothetical protein
VTKHPQEKQHRSQERFCFSSSGSSSKKSEKRKRRNFMNDLTQQEIQENNSPAFEAFRAAIGAKGQPYFSGATSRRNIGVLYAWIEQHLPGGLDGSGSVMGSYEIAYKQCQSDLLADENYVSPKERTAFLERLKKMPASEQSKLYNRDASFRRLYDITNGGSR